MPRTDENQVAVVSEKRQGYRWAVGRTWAGAWAWGEGQEREESSRGARARFIARGAPLVAEFEHPGVDEARWKRGFLDGLPVVAPTPAPHRDTLQVTPTRYRHLSPNQRARLRWGTRRSPTWEGHSRPRRRNGNSPAFLSPPAHSSREASAARGPFWPHSSPSR